MILFDQYFQMGWNHQPVYVWCFFWGGNFVCFVLQQKICRVWHPKIIFVFAKMFLTSGLEASNYIFLGRIGRVRDSSLNILNAHSEIWGRSTILCHLNTCTLCKWIETTSSHVGELWSNCCRIQVIQKEVQHFLSPKLSRNTTSKFISNPSHPKELPSHPKGIICPVCPVLIRGLLIVHGLDPLGGSSQLVSG